jgi:type I restriction enzyme S subunit
LDAQGAGTARQTFGLLQQDPGGRHVLAEHKFARGNTSIALLAKGRKLIDRLNQAVLAKAFSGELVPQDPNDEPASVLLERTRAQRQTTSTTQQSKRRKKAE